VVVHGTLITFITASLTNIGVVVIGGMIMDGGIKATSRVIASKVYRVSKVKKVLLMDSKASKVIASKVYRVSKV
jgi:hypothetical protein